MTEREKQLRSQQGYVNSRSGQKASYHGVVISDFALQEMYGPGGSREMCAVITAVVPLEDISPHDLVVWSVETFPVFREIEKPMNIFGPAGLRVFCGDSSISVRCTRFWRQKDRYSVQLVLSLGKGSPLYDMSVKKLQGLLDGWAQKPN